MMPPQPTAYPGIPPGMPAPGYGVVPGTDMRSLNSGVANMTVDENGGFVPATGQVCPPSFWTFQSGFAFDAFCIQALQVEREFAETYQSHTVVIIYLTVSKRHCSTGKLVLWSTVTSLNTITCWVRVVPIQP